SSMVTRQESLALSAKDPFIEGLSLELKALEATLDGRLGHALSLLKVNESPFFTWVHHSIRTHLEVWLGNREAALQSLESVPDQISNILYVRPVKASHLAGVGQSSLAAH